MLEYITDGSHNIQIPHNRLHIHMLKEDLSVKNEKKKKRHKWIRYEREHSISVGRINWHEDEKNSIKVCAILDDASRKTLAGGEFETIDTENSKKVIDQMVGRYRVIYPLRELIMGHGSEFGAHRRDESGNWNSEFEQYLVDLGIKPILTRVKHPQINGKLEKWFDTYQRVQEILLQLR